MLSMAIADAGAVAVGKKAASVNRKDGWTSMRLRVFGLTIAAVASLTAPAGASAHEFEFNGAVPVALGGKALTAQKFKFTAGLVACEKATLAGNFGPPKASKTFEVKVKYSECEAFGSKATITEAEYRFDAEGLVSVVGKPIVITDVTGKCTVEISSGTENVNLKTVKYSNGSKALLVKAGVLHIEYAASGGFCGRKT